MHVVACSAGGDDLMSTIGKFERKKGEKEGSSKERFNQVHVCAAKLQLHMLFASRELASQSSYTTTKLTEV